MMATVTTTADEQDDKVVPFDRSLKAPRGVLKPEGQFRNRWFFKAGPDVTQDHIRHQEFWANCSFQLTRHDLITVLANDESWEVELCVERVLSGAVEVSVRKNYKRTSIVHAGRVVDGIGEYYSEWRANDGWCVVRKSDGHPIVKNHTLEEGAISAWRAGLPRKVG